jgi:copper(I)-binding protein
LWHFGERSEARKLVVGATLPGSPIGVVAMKSSFAVAIALALSANSAQAFDYKISGLEIDRPWARATAKGAKVGAGYVKITNTGTAPDKLLGGSFSLSERLEVHEMSMDAVVMKMRELKSGLEIKPGASVELKPGSYHLMFTNLTRPLARGDRVKGTLKFEKAGTVEVEFAVEALGASAGHGGHGRGH